LSKVACALIFANPVSGKLPDCRSGNCQLSGDVVSEEGGGHESGIRIPTLNSPPALFLWLWERRPLRNARWCAGRTKLDLDATRKGFTDRVEAWTWQRVSAATSRGEDKANPVLHCPYVHSTLAFENEQINRNHVSMKAAGNCVFSASRTIISSWWHQAIDVT
jgi:hypothetical protein